MIRSRELARQHQTLVSLFDRVRLACGDDIEIRSHWARYLCVQCAGFVENGVKEIFGDFIARTSSAPVAKYASDQLGYLQNPKTRKILEIAASFKAEWREHLELYVSTDGRREAIDSIMQNRHQIAHGKYSGITIARVRQYFEKAVAVLEFLECECEK